MPSDMVRSLAVILVAVAASEVMYRFSLGNQIIIMLYLLAVQVISTVTSSSVYGILAALLGTFAYDFLIFDPRMGLSFTIGSLITLFIMVTAAITISTITARIKARVVVAFEREQRTQQLYEINQKLLATRNIASIAELTGEYLVGHLKCPAVLYTKDPALSGSWHSETPNDADGLEPLLYSGGQKEQVHRIFQEGGPSDEHHADSVFNVPVVSKGNVLGVIGIACKGKRLSQGELTFIWMLAGQVALALELQYLSDEQSLIVVESEKEKARSTLLRAVSHDFRTPLTGILGASSTILEQKDIDPATVETLVTDIKQHAQWLIRMVENILMLTRISGDNLKVKAEPSAAEEVVAEAVSIVRKRFSGYTFRVHIPNELLLVPMDATLISQVLINLLENAVKNSPEGSTILVNLERADGFAKFDIIDEGSGIPEYMLGALFDAQTVSKEKTVNVSRSTGLGLSICKTIVHAHGGSIEGNNRNATGAEFSFRLPLQEATKTNE